MFHSSVLMYDAWAIFDESAQPFFLGNTLGNFTTNYTPISSPTNKEEATKEIISYAIFKLLNHRFKNSPNSSETLSEFETFFTSLGYDKNYLSIDYSDGSYAALGNYMAEKMIEFGLQDGANEENNYENKYYTPVNDALYLEFYRDNSNINPNRWQPLAFSTFIDQSGNLFEATTPEFLGPEWGEVVPFSLKDEDLEVLNNGFNSYIYNNPGNPVYIQESNQNGITDPYKWNFALVIAWSAHLDPSIEDYINISPNSIGNVNISTFPTTFSEYQNFYNFTQGGDIGKGHSINPITNKPYEDNIVKKGDYTRVLAEFWADGPDSETPPGHWFTILNYVIDHPLSKKTFGNSSKELSSLEFDVKSYLTLGGAMHDVAVNIWGIKGYYDYIRPISAIRYMASKGQSSDINLPNYSPHGLPLIEGLIEVIKEGDELVGFDNEIIGQIKVKSWLGHDEISNVDTDIAKVGWILGTHWWPYQRPSFVSPPFAGYLSGHSTFSRAASEVLTLITNNTFFPGGMGTFNVEKNKFLAFEVGPSESLTLQWATYRDASDQTSLSRIWGGIHPPIDDIKGRIIGDKIGKEAFSYAQNFFNGVLSTKNDLVKNKTIAIYPNPFKNKLYIKSKSNELIKIELFDILGKKIFSNNKFNEYSIELSNLNPGVYFIKVYSKNGNLIKTEKIIKSMVK
ncbi:T9SS type A sorting domain-containing protein [Polaribacter ponticola]|uniref:T9SS type A sorting domain-containing protein n=1 Tax=Polaribacter ponticola TaxID=2978475 RepID=A0ABT5S7C6_9FLAO|nr:T9SS type A sorting domain-containing protein [Polaribacter sp. MSW5]MDD7914000.1 T9SS type A sorting domain-containing protein [Polaribacter sp. MSW5]